MQGNGTHKVHTLHCLKIDPAVLWRRVSAFQRQRFKYIVGFIKAGVDRKLFGYKREVLIVNWW